MIRRLQNELILRASAVFTLTLIAAQPSFCVADISTGWQLVREVPSPHPALNMFGVRVGVHSGMVVASAVSTGNDPYFYSGSAFTFSSMGSDYPLELLPIGRPEENAFLYTAISASRVLIGDDEDPNPTTGAAYLFDRATGAQIARLTAPDGIGGRDFWFGQDVALTPQYAVVLAAGFQAGGAYVYDAENGNFVRKLVAGPAPFRPTSMDAETTLALVGTINTESAHLIHIETGALLKSFVNPFPAADDLFGIDVALGKQYAAVSSRHSGSGSQGGLVSVFNLESGMLSYSIEGNAFQHSSIDIDGRFLILGAPFQSSTPTRIFDLPSGDLLAELPHAETVAIHGRMAVLGQDRSVLVYMLIPEPGGFALATVCIACCYLWPISRCGRR